MSVQKSRPRPSHTCDQCKRRKLKCDQRRPVCGRCAATPGSQCSYAHNLVPPCSSQLDSSAVRSTLQADLALGSTISISDERIQHLEERLNRLSESVQSLRNSRGSIPSDASTFTERQSIASQVTGPEPDFLAAQSGSRVRYVSRAFWARLCEENGVIEELLRE